MSIFIVLKINLWPFTVVEDSALRNSLFGAVNLTNILDPIKHKYSGYGIEYAAHGGFSLSGNSGFGKSVIIFDADMSSSVYVDNKKDTLNTLLILVNKERNFVQIYIIMEQIVIYLLMMLKSINSKQQILK